MATKKKKIIYVGQPSYGGAASPEVYNSVFRHASRGLHETVPHAIGGISLLAHAFNRLWCNALNVRVSRGVTHFAMLHSDIVCEEGWLDTLAAEMDRFDADVVSACVPIKSPHGLTSTALSLSPDDTWRFDRRITVHELQGDALPDTFDAADAGGAPGSVLLINSGCWLARLDRPWCEKVCFTVNDRIVRDEKTGHFEPQVESEDWNFGRQLHALGCRVLATKKVRLKHYGHYGYPSHHAGDWGQWQHDVQHRS